jgi:hypothetical protein
MNQEDKLIDSKVAAEIYRRMKELIAARGLKLVR